MALSPVITATLNNNGQTMTVVEATGVYDATTNTGGWETPNIAGSDVVTATITITYADGSTQVEDVTAQIPATVTGTFTFTDITLSGYQDGITVIRYEIETVTTTYAYDLTLLFSCNVRACIDKMWADVACQTCSGSCDVGSLIDDANLAEALYNAMGSAGACGNSAYVNKILESLMNLCNWENCNC